MIEALLESQFRLPSDFDTIISIVRVNDDAAVITSTFAIWQATRDHAAKAGFTVSMIAQRPFGRAA